VLTEDNREAAMKVFPLGAAMVEHMAPKIVTVQEAEGHLLERIRFVENGAEVVITHENQPKVQLVPMGSAPQKRLCGKGDHPCQ
jgi:hypothetical protein